MTESIIRWSEQRGIVTLTFDDPTQSVNTMNAAYRDSMGHALRRLQDMGERLAGVVLTSAKPTFFAGGDLHDLLATHSADAERLTQFCNSVKTQLRALERLCVPVVAVIGGNALGGGLELALACHHRVLLDRPEIRVGLPEVTLGLLPGGGGIARTVRMLGLEAALTRVLLPGTAFTPAEAVEIGLVDELASSQEDALARARAWIAVNRDARQQWDVADLIPGGRASEPHVEATLPGLAASLRASHCGAPMQAEANILCAAVEGTLVDVETAFAIETSYFVELAIGQTSKNIIQGTFFDLRTVRSGGLRRDRTAPYRAQRVAVLGAGTAGLGIALSAASVGIDVMLLETAPASNQGDKEHAAKCLAGEIAQGDLSEGEAEAILSRIKPVATVAGLGQADLVIEAASEDFQLNSRALKEALGKVAPDALLVTTPSTLSIGSMGRSINAPTDFIGLHFLPPVQRAELVEILAGEQTSDKTLSNALDFVRQLRKIPIVVRDGRASFATRLIVRRVLEAAAMLEEGVAPASIEQASLQAGYRRGSLALTDQLGVNCALRIYRLLRDDAASAPAAWDTHAGGDVLAFMVEEAGRPGRAAHAGYYEYRDGLRQGLWHGLEARFGSSRQAADLTVIGDRLLFAEAIEAARCLNSGIVRSTPDANVGSLLGVGYPRWTGGVAQFVSGYPSGVRGFVVRAHELAQEFGSHFEPPAFLVERAQHPGDLMIAHA